MAPVCAPAARARVARGSGQQSGEGGRGQRQLGRLRLPWRTHTPRRVGRERTLGVAREAAGVGCVCGVVVVVCGVCG